MKHRKSLLVAMGIMLLYKAQALGMNEIIKKLKTCWKNKKIYSKIKPISSSVGPAKRQKAYENQEAIEKFDTAVKTLMTEEQCDEQELIEKIFTEPKKPATKEEIESYKQTLWKIIREKNRDNEISQKVLVHALSVNEKLYSINNKKLIDGTPEFTIPLPIENDIITPSSNDTVTEKKMEDNNPMHTNLYTLPNQTFEPSNTETTIPPTPRLISLYTKKKPSQSKEKLKRRNKQMEIDLGTEDNEIAKLDKIENKNLYIILKQNFLKLKNQKSHVPPEKKELLLPLLNLQKKTDAK